MDFETKRQALANYLEVPVEDIQDDYGYFKYGKEEYRVLTDEEADQAMQDYIEDIIDDCGICFGDAMNTWIIEYALDNPDWFDEALREDTEYYVNDMDEEELIDNLNEYGILDKDRDYHYAEDDLDYEHPILNDNIDLDSKREELIEKIIDKTGDAYDWYVFNFGEDQVRDLIKNGEIGIDTKAIADEIASWDGRGPSLSSYDGYELELDDDLYAYRTN